MAKIVYILLIPGEGRQERPSQGPARAQQRGDVLFLVCNINRRKKYQSWILHKNYHQIIFGFFTGPLTYYLFL